MGSGAMPESSAGVASLAPVGTDICSSSGREKTCIHVTSFHMLTTEGHNPPMPFPEMPGDILEVIPAPVESEWVTQGVTHLLLMLLPTCAWTLLSLPGQGRLPAPPPPELVQTEAPLASPRGLSRPHGGDLCSQRSRKQRALLR